MSRSDINGIKADIYTVGTVILISFEKPNAGMVLTCFVCTAIYIALRFFPSRDE